MLREDNKPLTLVFSVTAEKPDYEIGAHASQRKPVVQVMMTGDILETGIAFTKLDAATDGRAPAEVIEIIENLFPLVGQVMCDARASRLKPDPREERTYDMDSGERVFPPRKLDS